jgi:hypothetical protein
VSLPFLELAPLVSSEPPPPGVDTLTINAADGRCLLRIGPAPDYRWTIEPEDAPEAARIFAESLRQLYLGK